MKKSIILSITLLLFSLILISDEREVIQKVRGLYSQRKFEEALSEIEKGVKEFGETKNLLSAKFFILMEMGKFKEAAETAIKKDNLSEKKSPWNSFDVMRAYLRLKEFDKAIGWLEKSIERGFISYKELGGAEFNEIRENPKFKKAVSNLMDKIGIGKPAKDFSVETINGEKFILSEQKGKVILIQFWASWCPGCRAEMPNVKSCYNEFKDKGFDIIGISLDFQKETMMKYLESEGVNWNIAFSGKAWEDEIAKLYGVNSIPSLWLVDRKGNLRYFDLRGEELKEAIKVLLD
ncbi:MAG: redoxin domain-containing protein [Candidatus Aminicenantia bacterium]